MGFLFFHLAPAQAIIGKISVFLIKKLIIYQIGYGDF